MRRLLPAGIATAVLALTVSACGSGSPSTSGPGTTGAAPLRRARGGRRTVVLAGLESPQGLAFARRGGDWVLHVGESDQIDAYPWRGYGPGVPSTTKGASVPIATVAAPSQILARASDAGNRPPAPRLTLPRLDDVPHDVPNAMR